MNTIQVSRKEKGFTIIELVVVILLLGILAATALPRFIDVSEQAHDSVVSATRGGLQTGLSLYRAQWVAEGQAAVDAEVGDYGDDAAMLVSAAGYPAAGTTAEACMTAYSGLLQTGAPSIVNGEDTAPDWTDADENLQNPSADFTAFAFQTAVAGALELTGEQVCFYLYTADEGFSERSLAYLVDLGQVLQYASLEAAEDDLISTL